MLNGIDIIVTFMSISLMLRKIDKFFCGKKRSKQMTCMFLL
ncbi:hypothetical protein HMPREF9541_02389 [Escherichia coli MS 116-1]|nr:hypothetical protein HMPREF9541_02389 [Escherichia coli MS 116-1]